MAYGNYFAVVDWIDVAELREGSRQTLEPVFTVFFSQLVSFWVKENPLGEYLEQILNGGEDLSPSFWHPFQTPKVHSPKDVQLLEMKLRAAWGRIDDEAKAAHPFQREINLILETLEMGVTEGKAVLSVLEPPADKERAERVKNPFNSLANLPVPWGDLAMSWNR